VSQSEEVARPATAPDVSAPLSRDREPQRERGRDRGMSTHFERYGALGVLVITFIVFSILRPDTFPTTDNVKTLLISQGVVAVVTIGLLLPMAAGEFDLSIGFVVSFTGIVVGSLTAQHGWNTWPAIGVCVLVAIVLGLTNGLLVVGVGINSFIATLGTGTIVSGLTIWISNGEIIYQGLPDLIKDLAQTQLFGLQMPVYVMIVSAIVFAYILRNTPFGRYLYAVGGGRETARLAGVPTGRLIVIAFIGCALMSTLAGVLNTGLAGAAQPSAGDQYFLPAFAAAFLGATTFEPGRFNVVGTIIALFLLAVLVAGLQQLGAPFWVSPVFNGLALITAVGLSSIRRRGG
jgi:ribose transport system permease protein